mgnify:CR=1 FL=1
MYKAFLLFSHHLPLRHLGHGREDRAAGHRGEEGGDVRHVDARRGGQVQEDDDKEGPEHVPHFYHSTTRKLAFNFIDLLYAHFILYTYLLMLMNKFYMHEK